MIINCLSILLEFPYIISCNSSLYWKGITIPCSEDEYSTCNRGWRLLGQLLDCSYQNLHQLLPELSQEPPEISRFTFIFSWKSFQMFLFSTALKERLNKQSHKKNLQTQKPNSHTSNYFHFEVPKLIFRLKLIGIFQKTGPLRMLNTGLQKFWNT